MRPIAFDWKIREETCEVYERHAAALAALASGDLADAVAAVETACETYATGNAELPDLVDLPSYAIGWRLVRSLDYCETARLPNVAELMSEMAVATTRDSSQAWHAESHLHYFAQLHAAACNNPLGGNVVIVPKGSSPTPDIGLDRIGLEVTIRPPSAEINSEETLLRRLRAAVEHAADKAGPAYERVVALMDFGPLDITKNAQAARLFGGRKEFYVQQIDALLGDFPTVPALLIGSLILERRQKTGSLAITPRFRHSFQQNKCAKPLPNAHRKLLSPIFDVPV